MRKMPGASSACLALKCAVFALLAIALADPWASMRMQKLAVTVLLDTSASMPRESLLHGEAMLRDHVRGTPQSSSCPPASGQGEHSRRSRPEGRHVYGYRRCDATGPEHISGAGSAADFADQRRQRESRARADSSPARAGARDCRLYRACGRHCASAREGAEHRLPARCVLRRTVYVVVATG